MGSVSIDGLRERYLGKSDKQIAAALAKEDPGIFAIVRYKLFRDKRHSNFGICWNVVEIDNYLLNDALFGVEIIYDRRNEVRDVREILDFYPSWAREQIAPQETPSPKYKKSTKSTTSRKRSDTTTTYRPPKPRKKISPWKKWWQFWRKRNPLEECTYQAKHHFRRGNLEEALVFVKKGMQIDYSYPKLLHLKEKIEEKQRQS